MDKTALKVASRMLDEVPAYNTEALEDYIARNKKAQSNLKADVNGPRSLSAFEYSEAGTTLEELNLKMEIAGNHLAAVRNEEPHDIDSGYEEEFDLPSTVNRLAAQKAMQTYDMPQLEQFYAAKRAFTENIEPILVDGFEEFPRQQYMDAFNRFASLPPAELRRVIAEEFPTEEWIGKAPEAPADDTPTAEGEDGAPDPEDSYIDQEFGGGQYKSVLKNRQSSKTAGKNRRYVKIADGLDLDDDLSDLPGSVEPLDSVSEDAGGATYWVQHGKDLIGFDPADVQELQVVPEAKTETQKGFDGALDGGGGDSSGGDGPPSPPSDSDGPPSPPSDSDEEDSSSFAFGDEDEDDEEEDDSEEKESGRTGSSKAKVKRKRAVENNQGADIVGQGNKDPESDDAMELWFEGESNKGNGSPTGPDRDKRSSRDKLSAALKIAKTYDIDADAALDLVEKVLEDE